MGSCLNQNLIFFFFFKFPISNDYDLTNRSGSNGNKELVSLAQLAYLQQKIQLCSCPLNGRGGLCGSIWQ